MEQLSIGQVIARALAAAKAGEVDTALGLASRLLATIPEDPRALLLPLHIHLLTGRFDAARQTARTLTGHRPDLTEPWRALAADALRDHQPDNATAPLRRARVLAPGDLELPPILMRWAHRTRSAAEAARHGRRAALLRPDDPETVILTALSIAEADGPDRAADWLGTPTASSPAEVWVQTGALRVRAGRWTAVTELMTACLTAADGRPMHWKVPYFVADRILKTAWQTDSRPVVAAALGAVAAALADHRRHPAEPWVSALLAISDRAGRHCRGWTGLPVPPLAEIRHRFAPLAAVAADGSDYRRQLRRGRNQAHLLPEPPPLADLGLSPDTNIVLVSGDRSYWQRFGTDLAASLATFATAPCLLHVHLIGLTPAEAAAECRQDAMLRIRVTSEPLPPDPEATLPTYYACARFGRLLTLLRHYRRPILVSDLDTLYVADPGRLIRATPPASVALAHQLDAPQPPPWYRAAAGYVVVHPDARGLAFARRLRDHIVALATTGRLRWWADQTVLEHALCGGRAGDRVPPWVGRITFTDGIVWQDRAPVAFDQAYWKNDPARMARLAERMATLRQPERRPRSDAQRTALRTALFRAVLKP